MPACRAILGPIATAGVGINSTVFIKSVHNQDAEGRRSKQLDGPSASPYARPGGDPVVLVQDGLRRGCTLQEAVRDAREGALILLRPGVHQGPITLSHPGVTLGGDGPCGQCILEAGAEKPRTSGAAADEASATDKSYGTLVCQAHNTRVYNVTIRWAGAPLIYYGSAASLPPQGSAAVVVASGFLSIVNCDVCNPQGMGVLVRRQGDAHILANRIVGSGASAVSLEAHVTSQVYISICICICLRPT